MEGPGAAAGGGGLQLPHMVPARIGVDVAYQQVPGRLPVQDGLDDACPVRGDQGAPPGLLDVQVIVPVAVGDDLAAGQPIRRLRRPALEGDHRVQGLPVVQGAVHRGPPVLRFNSVQAGLDVGRQGGGVVPGEKQGQQVGPVGRQSGARRQGQHGGQQEGRPDPLFGGRLCLDGDGGTLPVQGGSHPGPDPCRVGLRVQLGQVQLRPQLMDVA